MILYAVGAYGREARRDDWAAGKDFAIAYGGPYFSIRDIDKLKIDGYTEIHFMPRLGQVRLFTEVL